MMFSSHSSQTNKNAYQIAPQTAAGSFEPEAYQLPKLDSTAQLASNRFKSEPFDLNRHAFMPLNLDEVDDLTRSRGGQTNRISPDAKRSALPVDRDDPFASLNRKDSLTGLSRNQAIVGQSQANRLLGSSYSPIWGYGVVDAAKAVAWARGFYPYAYPEVPNWGGVHTGNDIVKAQESWNAGFAGQGVTVAVIDSGVDITHPDLDNNIWRNPGEIAGDGVDNDRNGYVDDLFGWNFGAGQNNNNVMPGTNSPGQAHGTHVAGTIAAEFNQIGGTGVAPLAQIMSLRLGNVNSSNQFTNGGDLARAIRYAVDNGAKVINISLGWSDSPQLARAMAYAASRNVITVSAAGNNSLRSPGTPARYATDFGVSVGAIDNTYRMASFSNWAGNNSQMQHVVAPGVDVFSTMPNGRYGTMSGTSMAAPHVAGVAALMLSANPNLTHAQMRWILTQSAVS